MNERACKSVSTSARIVILPWVSAPHYAEMFTHAYGVKTRRQSELLKIQIEATIPRAKAEIE
jgi:hypothetical protein